MTILSSSIVVTCLMNIFTHMQLVTCHLSLVTCHLSLVTCHLSLVTCHLSLVTCHLSLVTCHLSLVTCHLSLVTCHLSLVTCHLSLVKYTHLKNKKASNLSAGFFVKLKPRRLAYPHKLTAVVYHLESPLHQSQLYSSSLMMVIRT